jgi:hypothetical protein
MVYDKRNSFLLFCLVQPIFLILTASIQNYQNCTQLLQKEQTVPIYRFIHVYNLEVMLCFVLSLVSGFDGAVFIVCEH